MSASYSDCSDALSQNYICTWKHWKSPVFVCVVVNGKPSAPQVISELLPRSRLIRAATPSEFLCLGATLKPWLTSELFRRNCLSVCRPSVPGFVIIISITSSLIIHHNHHHVYCNLLWHLLSHPSLCHHRPRILQWFIQSVLLPDDNQRYSGLFFTEMSLNILSAYKLPHRRCPSQLMCISNSSVGPSKDCWKQIMWQRKGRGTGVERPPCTPEAGGSISHGSVYPKAGPAPGGQANTLRDICCPQCVNRWVWSNCKELRLSVRWKKAILNHFKVKVWKKWSAADRINTAH